MGNLLTNGLGTDADAFNQVPGKPLLHQKLSLLPFFDRGINAIATPVVRCHRLPIDFAEPRDAGAVLEIIRPCIGQRKSPPLLLGLRPSDPSAECGKSWAVRGRSWFSVLGLSLLQIPRFVQPIV